MVKKLDTSSKEILPRTWIFYFSKHVMTEKFAPNTILSQ